MNLALFAAVVIVVLVVVVALAVWPRRSGSATEAHGALDVAQAPVDPRSAPPRALTGPGAEFDVDGGGVPPAPLPSTSQWQRWRTGDPSRGELVLFGLLADTPAPSWVAGPIESAPAVREQLLAARGRRTPR